MCPPAEIPPIEMEVGLILREAADSRTYCGLGISSAQEDREGKLSYPLQGTPGILNAFSPRCFFLSQQVRQ